MNLTERSLKSPVGAASALALIIVLGIVALIKLPCSSSRTSTSRSSSIFTGWRAAAPTEVESVLIEPRRSRRCAAWLALQETPVLRGTRQCVHQRR